MFLKTLNESYLVSETEHWIVKNINIKYANKERRMVYIYLQHILIIILISYLFLEKFLKILLEL